MPEPLLGALMIGDPHLASRNPGFRKDDYSRAILAKLRWCLDQAAERRLLPVLLGDLFHWPRDNANWLLSEVIQLLAGRGVIGIVGNHDTTEKSLTPDDSLHVVWASGVLRLVDQTGPWVGELNGVRTVIGGTSWSEFLPTSRAPEPDSLVIWLSHHNLRFGDGAPEFFEPRALPGIDLVVNGHLHRAHPPKVTGSTTWMNPGNIARVQRADAVREARPAVLIVRPGPNRTSTSETLEVPHMPFTEVFHDIVPEADPAPDQSAFIRGLEQLRRLRTDDGTGLADFIHANIGRFDEPVRAEILSLMKEVCDVE